MLFRSRESGRPLPALTGERLRAVAALWARGEREITARFAGTSMLPTIAPDAEVLLDCGHVPEPGEIACYVRGDDVVVHRVVARTADGRWLLTRGDASLLPDPPSRAADVLARIRKVRRDGRWTEPAPAPGSFVRAAAVSLSRAALSVSPALGRGVIGGLWMIRRALLALRPRRPDRAR